MSRHLMVSGVAAEVERQVGVPIPPRIISDIIYQRKVDVRDCPIIAGRRLVPRSLIPEFVRVIQRRNRKS